MFNIQTLRDSFTNQDANLILSDLGIIVSISIPVFLAIITYQLNKKSKLEEQLLQKKREAFEGFIKTLFDSLYKKNKDRNEKLFNEQLEKGMLDFKKNLILYASQETINANNQWINNHNFRESIGKPDDKSMFVDVDYLLFCLRKEIGLEDNDYANTPWSKITSLIFTFLKLDFLFGQRKNARLQTIIKDDLEIFFGKSIKWLPLKISDFFNKVIVFYLVGGITSLIIKSINMVRIILKKETIKHDEIKHEEIKKSFEKLEKNIDEQFKKQ